MYSLIIIFILIVFFYRIPLSRTIVEFKNNNRLKKEGAKTNGKIVDIKEMIDSDGLKTYSPIIEFTSIHDNKTYRFSSPDLHMEKPVIGKTLNIKYSMEEPENAIIDRGNAFDFTTFKLVLNISVIIFLFVLAVINLKKLL